MFKIIKVRSKWYEVRFLYKPGKVHYAFTTFQAAREWAVNNL